MSASQGSVMKTQSPINVKDFEEDEAVESEDLDGFVNVDTEEEDAEEEDSSESLRDFVVNDEEEEEQENQKEEKEGEEEEKQGEEKEEEGEEEKDGDEKIKQDSIKNEIRFELSDLELESLVSKAMVELALQLEKQVSIHKPNPFTNHLDEIAFSKKFDMKKVLSNMDEAIGREKGKDLLLHKKLEPEQCLMESTDPQNLRFLNESATLDYTIFSPSSFNNNTGTNDMFVKEEMNLAEQTMKKALTRRQNLEKKASRSSIIK